MRVLTEIGEIGVHAGGESYLLCPSLYAMSRLGQPREIVEIYARLMGRFPPIVDALAVIDACGEGGGSVFGAWRDDDGKLCYQPGDVSAEVVIHLARCLLKHGVTGALPDLLRKAGQEPEYIQEFDARANVSLAIAHLGVSSKDAWQMTMTELVGALRAKFPPAPDNSPGARAPTKEQHEATMEWYERVEAARRAKSGMY